MLFSITIATRGLIERGRCPALCIATDGLIHVAVVKKKRPYDSGGGVYPYEQRDDRPRRQILKEDEELFEMITIIVPIL